MAPSRSPNHIAAEVPQAAEFVYSARAADFAERLHTDREGLLGEFSTFKFVAFDLEKGRVVHGSNHRSALVQMLVEEHGEDFGSRFLVEHIGG